MKTMKKIFALLLAVMLLVGMFSVNTLAAGNMIIDLRASEESVRAGDTFTVTLDLVHNPGAIAFVLNLNYDSDMFELVSSDGSNSCFPGYVGTQTADSNTFGWFDMTGALTGNNYSTGELIVVTFKVKDGAAGTGVFSVTANSSTDYDENELNIFGGEIYLPVMIDPEDCTRHQWVEIGYEVEPTCDEGGVALVQCSLCGSTKTQLVGGYGHDWGEGVVTTEATCEEDGVLTYTCWNDVAHTKTEVIEAIGHDWDEGKVTTEPTCNSKGVMTYTCKNDNTHTKTEEIASVDHELTQYEGKAATCTEDGWKAYEACANCDYTTYEAIEALGHEWNDGEVTTEPACGTEGVMTYTCKNCPATMKNGIAALDHDCTTHEGKPATCEEGGWKPYVTCSNCDYTTYEAIPALGHDWGEGEVTTEATCTTDGVLTYTCKNDKSHIKTEDIAATGHDLTQYEGKAATCTEDGWKAYEACSVCDYTTYEAIEALGHDITKHSAQDPTCEEAGWKSYEDCANCDYTTYEAIAALGHDWNNGEITTDATCTADGVLTYTCKNDKAHTKTEVIEATGHDWDEGEVTTEPTCETKGVMTYTCQNDDAHVTTADIEPIGHDWDDGKVALEPTCETNGEMVYTCKNDKDHTKTEDIDATGHNWNSGEVTTAPTCDSEGVKTYTCLNDETHTTTESIPATGHTYADTATFVWTEDTDNATYTATYRVECVTKGCDHVESGNAVISVETSTAANCKETGKTTYKATVNLDGLVYTETKTVNGAAGEHIWNDGEVTTEPTCVDKGVMTYTCTLDETHAKTEDIEATGHKYEQKTVAGSDENGHWYACDNGCEITSEPEAHTEGTPATCVSGALCEVCDTAFGDVDPEAHVWNDGEITLEPDCTTETPGNKHFICTLDETHIKDEEVPAEHTWDSGEVTKEPTTTEEGVRTFHCTVDGCEGTKTESIDKLASGSGSNTGTGEKSPKTGDNTNITIWVILLAVSITGILALLAMNSKKKGTHTR